MPKIILLVYLILLSVVLSAQNYSLVIFSNAGSVFKLSVNNQLINQTAQSNVKTFNLKAGWQHIFVELNTANDGVAKTFKDSILIKVNEKVADNEFTYTLFDDNGKLKLRFVSSSVPSGPNEPAVPQAPKEKVPLIDNTIYGNLYKAVNNNPEFYKNYNNETKSCSYTLFEREANYGLNLLTKCYDDEKKLRYINSIIENNCISTAYLIKLLDFLPMEMDRLNSSKLAYSHLTDPENNLLLLPSFKYQTVKDAYSNFILEVKQLEKQKQLNCKEPINESSFTSLHAKIKNTAYENEKVKLAKKALVTICINTLQAKELVNLLSHDREKLDLLKSIIPVLTDKENTKNLAEELQYSESKTEFLNQI